MILNLNGDQDIYLEKNACEKIVVVRGNDI